ncbi:hypothetical protein HDE_13753 [Halotydeus destructor]|nr:hypothetical protein HDE_13753 [Halotydeus destructor]
MNGHHRGHHKVTKQNQPRLLAIPVPEPPRVINPRPLVPDLSITSDAQSFEVTAPSPAVKRPAIQQHDFHARFNSQFPVCIRQNGLLSAPPPPHGHYQHHRQLALASAVTSNLRPDAQLLPRQYELPVVAKHKPVRENKEVYEMLQKHDEYLQLISQQIQELLNISEHRQVNDSNKMEPKPTMCTAETMTSLVWPHDDPRKVTDNRKSSGCGVTSVMRESERRRLVTIDESPSSSERVSPTYRKAFLPSMVRFSSDTEDSPVREMARGIDENYSSDSFYDNMLANIDGILRNSSVEEESEGDITRSSCSPSPPRHSSNRQRKGQRIAEVETMTSSETIYINRLAEKYLLTERREKPYQPNMQTAPKEPLMAEKARKCTSRKDYDVKMYGISCEVSSIATKNYLEKYGLLNDHSKAASPRAHYSQRRKGPEPAQNAKPNRILDLDRLKRQTKYK